MSWNGIAPVLLGVLTCALFLLVRRDVADLAQKQRDFDCLMTAALRKLGRLDYFRESMEDGRLPDKLMQRLAEEVLAMVATGMTPAERELAKVEDQPPPSKPLRR